MAKVNNNKPKEHGSNQYSTEYILDRLRKHMVDDKKSFYTITKPTRYGIVKRIKNGDKELERGFREIEAEHFAVFEEALNDAIFNGAEINMVAFNTAIRNKRPFLDTATLELEDRIAELENVKQKKLDKKHKRTCI